MKPPPPLPPELEAFLSPHRGVSPLPLSLESRAMARAQAAVEWSPGLRSRAGQQQRWVFAAAASTVVLVGAAAYAAHGWFEKRSASVTTPSPATTTTPRVTAPRGGEAPPAVPPLAAPELAGPETVAPEATRRRRAMSRTSPASIRTTHAELSLLRMARRDVTNGDYAEALAIIAEHARRFGNGSLLEEREALRVSALAGLGRREDARRAAAELRARFPHSVFLPTFERLQGADR